MYKIGNPVSHIFVLKIIQKKKFTKSEKKTLFGSSLDLQTDSMCTKNFTHK